MSATRPWPATTAARPWRAPTGTGATVHLIGDLHTVVPRLAGHTRNESLRHDMWRLRRTLPGLSARVQVGDALHNMVAGDAGAQVPVVADLFASLGADGAPLVNVVGNHECNWGVGGDAIARRLGLPARNYVADHGPFRFVAYSPADLAETGVRPGTPAEPWVIGDEVLSWMDGAIGGTDRPVVLVSHCPPYEQYCDDDVGYFLTPVDRIAAMLAAHPNVVAWLSGHRHHWYNDAPNLFKSVTYGDHRVALIQAGCCGGTLDAIWRQPGHPVQSIRTNGSVFATYFGPGDPDGHRWECRVRDHSLGTWGTPSTDHRHLWTIPL